MRRCDWPTLIPDEPLPFAARASFETSRARVVIASAAVRTGKTRGAGKKVFRRIARARLAHPDMREPLIYWFVAPSYRMLSVMKTEARRHVPPWQIDAARQGRDRRWASLSGGGGTLYLRGNIMLRFLSADDPEALVAETVHGVWCTEGARLKAAALRNLFGRLANYRDSWLIVDTSPLGHCAFYREWFLPAVSRAMPDASVHEWRAIDSPYVPREEIDRARATLPAPWFRRDYEASWDAFEGQVYSEFDPLIHCVDAPPFAPRHAIVGVDLNVADTTPAAFLTLLHDGSPPAARTAHVESEYYRFGVGLDVRGYAEAIAQHVATLRARGLRVGVVVDPSAKLLREDLRRLGVPSNGAMNAVLEGIRCVATALHVREDARPRLTIARRCEHLVDELRGYRWAVSSSGVQRDRPDKALADHLLDALRYAAMAAWGRGDWSQAR